MTDLNTADAGIDTDSGATGASSEAANDTSNASGASGESTNTSGDTGSSAADIRQAQIDALKAVRGTDAPEDAAKSERHRAADGKFVGKGKDATGDTQKAEADETPATGEPKSQEQLEQPAGQPPAHLAPAIKAVWEKLPAEARDAVAGHTLKDRQAISRLGETVKAYEPFDAVIAQNRDYLQRIGSHPAQAFGNMLAWNQALVSDPVAEIPKLASNLKLTPAEAQALVNSISSQFKLTSSSSPALPNDGDEYATQTSPDMVALQARFDALQRQNQTLFEKLTQHDSIFGSLAERQAAEREAMAEQQRTAQDHQMRSTTEAFMKDKDPQEFNFLRPAIAKAIREMDDTVPEHDVLPRAYEIAKKQFDALLGGKLTAAQREQQERATKEAAAAKRAGSVNVTGVPEAPAAALSVREVQRQALANARRATH